jgi:hypothetical protein
LNQKTSRRKGEMKVSKENANDKLKKWLEDGRENKTYSICCKMCGNYIGESETDYNGSALCIDCYEKV